MSGSECVAAKRLHVITWGCQMNVYDSRRMADVLAPLGYEPVAAPDDADMVILNTCHIRDRAAEKVFSELGRLRRIKDARVAAGGRMILAVAGCLAQAEGAEILARAPFVDIVFGPQTYHRLPEMVARALWVAAHGHQGGDGEGDGDRGGAGAAPGGAIRGASGGATRGLPGGLPLAVIDTDFPAEHKFDFLPEASAPQGLSAFLTIQEGCDKFCSFCVVPYTRGAEMSRPAAAVLAEARKLVGQGAREIVLLGQNVNAWHGAGAWHGEGASPGTTPATVSGGGTWGLGRLLRAMAEIPGVMRLRYTTSHPRDMDDDLIAAHRDLPMLMPFLHLPVQSGSDRILTAMHRRHTSADYLRLVDRLRAARPDIALSSDFIVGHPGETEADFADTLALVRAVGFAQAFSFKYSPRPGTPAAGAADQVPEAEKDRRLYELQALLREQQARFNAGCVGLTLPVLFTGPGRHEGQVVGRSPFLQPVHMIGAASLIGRETPVHIAAAHTNSLSAIPIEERACA